ncbi:MAG: DUF2029 domain-containing protein, partial [Dactylosporangium sp.]|nr:DUF2029 domain-containing protein [Dactylosporangium sp.]NNJ61029.1 DUF2029 domain-containing protein [Dactylosporangium sp.]
TSPPTAVGMLLGYVLRVLGRPEAVGTAVAGARAVGVAVLAAVLLALLHRAVGGMGEVRSVVRRCGLALAAVVVLSPVAYPWYALAPLAVLAVTADARHYRWLAVAGCVLTLLVLPNGVGVAGLTKFPGALVVGSGAVALASVMVRRTRAGEAPAESATRGRGPAGR